MTIPKMMPAAFATIDPPLVRPTVTTPSSTFARRLRTA
jgi:hypothetical protein